MAPGEQGASWSRGQPPLFLWGAVVVSPGVMGLAGQGAPSPSTLSALALCLTLGFAELSPRQGRVLSVLVALLYVMMAALLAESPLGSVAALLSMAVLAGGALIGALCSWFARGRRGQSLATLVIATGYLLLLQMAVERTLSLSRLEAAFWQALPLGALAALVHVQMRRIAQTPGQLAGRRVWVVESLALLVGLGLVILLNAAAIPLPNADPLRGWTLASWPERHGAGAIGLGLCLLLTAAALHREIGPRGIAVTVVLYLAAHAAPTAELEPVEAAVLTGLVLLGLLPLRPLGPSGLMPTEEPLWFTSLQPAAEAWVVTFDFSRETVLLGPAAEVHFGPLRQIHGWLSQLSSTQSGALLGLLHGLSPAPVTVTLRGASAAEGRVPAPYQVHLLERQGSQSRVLLRRLATQQALEARSEGMQQELDRMRLREERLLALASHELRTPVATLSMLAEEIDDGEAWDELGPSLREAISLVLGVLDDLRARGKTEGELARAAEVSLSQVSLWLREEFGALADALGVSLELEIPRSEGARYICETGRLLLVLEKLLRYTINLPGLSRLRLTLVATPLGSDRFTLVWSVLPMGEQSLAMPDPGLFEPFATGPDAGLGATLQGAGLYTAEKAALGMGGSLRLQSDPAGFIFIFTHPVRRARAKALEPGKL